MTRERIVAFVRRGRARLEAIRVFRSVSRGALAGGGAGLILLLAGKLWPLGPSWLAWALLGAGALAGGLAALFSRGIGPVAAALFLDARLGTGQRIATLLTRDPGRFGARLLREVGGVTRLPRMPVPRELSLLPAALFLLFAAGMIPAASRDVAPAARSASTAAAEAAGSVEPPPDVSGAVARMERGDAPDGDEAARIEEAIERALHLPEERRDALGALKRALAGDGAAAKRVAEELNRAAVGGRGETGNRAVRGPLPVAVGARGGAAAAAYPELRELVLAYRRGLVEKRNQ